MNENKKWFRGEMKMFVELYIAKILKRRMHNV